MIVFKNSEKSDSENIVKMMEDFYSIDNYSFDFEIAKKLFLEFISNENLGKCWLIYDDKTPVGYVILTFVFSFEYQGKIAFLDELYIKEEFRGKGIGKATIEFIKNQANELSIKLMYLEVENQNINAQNLYLSQKFEFHNRKIMKFKV